MKQIDLKLMHVNLSAAGYHSCIPVECGPQLFGYRGNLAAAKGFVQIWDNNHEMDVKGSLLGL